MGQGDETTSAPERGRNNNNRGWARGRGLARGRGGKASPSDAGNGGGIRTRALSRGQGRDGGGEVRPRLGGLDAAIGTHGAAGDARNARVPESDAALVLLEDFGRQRKSGGPVPAETYLVVTQERRIPTLYHRANSLKISSPVLHLSAVLVALLSPKSTRLSIRRLPSHPTHRPRCCPSRRRRAHRRAPPARTATLPRVSRRSACLAPPPPPRAARVGARVGVPRSHSPRERRLVTVPPSPMRLHPLESSRAPDAPPAVNPSDVSVRETRVSGELRAAAAARALSFYTYPRTDPSSPSEPTAPFASTPSGTPSTPRSPATTSPTVTVASRASSPPSSSPQTAAFPRVSTSIPRRRVRCSSRCRRLPPPLVVLGTLDVNQGTKLPAEELTGVYPTLADPVPPGTRLDEDGKGTNAEGYGEDEKPAPGTRPARYRRAYLSNVCVLPPARRTGSGSAAHGGSARGGAGMGGGEDVRARGGG